MWDVVEEGTVDLLPERKQYDTLGAFPQRYWILGEVDTAKQDERRIPFTCLTCHKQSSIQASIYHKIKHRYPDGRVTHCYRCEQVKRRRRVEQMRMFFFEAGIDLSFEEVQAIMKSER